MKFTEYISTHHAFSTEELMSSCDSPASARQQLWAAAKTGKVEKVRRGVYVSFTGRFSGSIPDPFEVAHACDRDATLCYHSALTALGVAHNVSYQCDFTSDTVRSPFEYRGIHYVPHKQKTPLDTTKVRLGDDQWMLCTSKEQTLVDCMDRPWLAGGAEEVVRALTLFAYIDEEALLSILENKKEPSRARAGWLLSAMQDTWHVSSGFLESLHGSLREGPYRFGRPHSGNSGWSARWKLLLPESNREVESWISRR